jgi:hypothetical protein
MVSTLVVMYVEQGQKSTGEPSQFLIGHLLLFGMFQVGTLQRGNFGKSSTYASGNAKRDFLSEGAL